METDEELEQTNKFSSRKNSANKNINQPSHIYLGYCVCVCERLFLGCSSRLLSIELNFSPPHSPMVVAITPVAQFGATPTSCPSTPPRYNPHTRAYQNLAESIKISIYLPTNANRHKFTNHKIYVCTNVYSHTNITLLLSLRT